MKNYYINRNDEKIEILDEYRIDLSYKNIKEIYITSLNKCTYLDLSYNFLTEFNTDLQSYIATNCNFATNCKALYLHNNSLDEFEADLPNCKILTLHNNNISKFKAKLPRCEELDLRCNDLTEFKTDLPNIEELYLSYNNLTRFKVNLANCKTLDLQYNSLTTFKADLPKFQSLYLQYNDLSFKRINNKSTFYI